MNNTELVIKECVKTHGNKYNYSLVNYDKWNVKIEILCPVHGIFKQLYHAHKKGQGCPKCFYDKEKINNDNFIKKLNDKRGNKYDYSLVNYKNSNEKIKIICSKHGVFEQLPYNHLNGNDCPMCKDRKFTTNEFIEKSKQIHGNKYDYSKVNYINSRTKIEIICSVHGIFKQMPNNHLSGRGCKKCDVDNRKIDIFDFIDKSNYVHDYKYSYECDPDIVSTKNINITCPFHGVFKQTPNNHVSQKQGCPICNQSKGERKICNYLNSNNIKFVQEYKFKDCKNKKQLPFDFYLPDYNVCIEYDGRQHFESIDYFGGIESFNKLKINDNIKDVYCYEKKIYLFRIKYDDNVEEKLNILLKLVTTK